MEWQAEQEAKTKAQIEATAVEGGQARLRADGIPKRHE
jgi:hypothetical protein